MPQFKCQACHREYPISTENWKCKCGGLLMLDFTPVPFNMELVDTAEWSMWRYRRFFPLDNSYWRQVTMGEGMTPIVNAGQGLLLKLDYAMPTLSFKDRGAAMLIWLCKSIGVSKVIQDSSGNAGNSVAAYAARAGIACEIFVPRGTSQKKVDMIKSHGAQVTIFDGTRDQTAEACRKKAEEQSIYYASHVYNSMFYQGTKTYIYEVYEQLGRVPDNIFVPIGNGTLFFGVVLALKELLHGGCIEKMPQIIAVQSEMCAPIKQAFDIGETSVVKAAVGQTLAEGIAIGEPMRAQQILREIYDINARVITCSEQDILPARQALASMGLYVEHTTAATYAAYLQWVKEGSLQGESLVPMCGAGLKSDK